MAEVYIVPPESKSEPWRIRLRTSEYTRWLASVSEAALAQRLAEDYAKANGATLLPFDAEAWEVVRDLRGTCVKLLWDAQDDEGVGKNGAEAFEDSFNLGRQPLCDRFRKSSGRKVQCAGCPLQLVSGLDDCKALPIRKARMVAASGGAASKKLALELLQVVVIALDQVVHHMRWDR